MATTNWNIDNSHSEIHFKVKHMVISTVTGKFNEFTASAETEGDDFTTAKIKFEAKTASIDTGVADRDAHLRSDDFFNAEKYPALTFESTELVKKSDSDYVLRGNLTIRDITKPIELDVDFGGTTVDPWGLTRAGFEISGKINRKEYDLKWSAVTEAGGLVVSDEVKLVLNVEMVKAQPATA
ncbi:MAG: YceI family protein [Bacteroidetes bacterium]|nr:MAG: YceI family protein [Bacteroidota bacterium]